MQVNFRDATLGGDGCGQQESERGKVPQSISNFILSGASRECRVPLRLRSPRSAAAGFPTKSAGTQTTRRARFAPTGRAGVLRLTLRTVSESRTAKWRVWIGPVRREGADQRQVRGCSAHGQPRVPASVSRSERSSPSASCGFAATEPRAAKSRGKASPPWRARSSSQALNRSGSGQAWASCSASAARPRAAPQS